MGYEVEIKFRVEDLPALEARLASLAGSPQPAMAQEDVYLVHPCRDFAQTGEAFRLRREGQTLFLTYKGARLEGPAKTREEIEVPVGGAGLAHRAELLLLLERLGFQPLLRPIAKLRTPYRLVRHGRALTVAVDRAEGLGTFAEVETIAQGPDDLPEAQAAVMQLAESLELRLVEPRSYLRMALDHHSTATTPTESG